MARGHGPPSKADLVRQRARRGRGQSLVEFALVLPVVILVVLMALDFGRVFMGWVGVNSMARVGAHYASGFSAA